MNGKTTLLFRYSTLMNEECIGIFITLRAEEELN